MKIRNKRGERKRDLPPASPPVGVEKRETGGGENRVRECVERERYVENKRKRRRRKKIRLLAF